MRSARRSAPPRLARAATNEGASGQSHPPLRCGRAATSISARSRSMPLTTAAATSPAVRLPLPAGSRTVRQLAGRLGRGEIGDDRLSPLAELLRELLEHLAPPPGHQHVRAALVKSPGDCLSDPARGAGDERSASLDLHGPGSYSH